MGVSFHWPVFTYSSLVIQRNSKTHIERAQERPIREVPIIQHLCMAVPFSLYMNKPSLSSHIPDYSVEPLDSQQQELLVGWKRRVHGESYKVLWNGCKFSKKQLLKSGRKRFCISLTKDLQRSKRDLNQRHEGVHFILL